jgi:hypothetical protein
MYCVRESTELDQKDLRYDDRWGWVHITAEDPHTVMGTDVDVSSASDDADSTTVVSHDGISILVEAPPPEPPSNNDADVQNELLKLHYSAILEQWKLHWRDKVERDVTATKVKSDRGDATTAAIRAREDADRAAENSLVSAIHAAYIETAKGSLERGLKRGEFLTKVATLVGTTYTAIVGLSYGVGDKKTPLPPRGLAPVVFLAGALVLSAIYTSFLQRSVSSAEQLVPSSLGGTIREQRLKEYINWAIGGSLRRAWAMRGAIVCLGLGVLLLPLVFLRVERGGKATLIQIFGLELQTENLATSLITGAIAVIVLWIAIELLYTMTPKYRKTVALLAAAKGVLEPYSWRW